MLAGLPARTAQTVITSPPYFRLRQYGDHVDELGLEGTVDEYVQALRDIFVELGRVLRPDGVAWLNLGDGYSGNADRAAATTHHAGRARVQGITPTKVNTTQVARRKSLLGIPWRVALALQSDGWIIRNEIIWHKPNGTPERVTDRFTVRHEHLFMLTRAPRYYFDLDAVRVPAKKEADGWSNPGDVWKLSASRGGADHYAMYPAELPRRCILASTREGDTVLDPFSGAASTGVAALELARRYIGIDLYDRHTTVASKRLPTALMTKPKEK